MAINIQNNVSLLPYNTFGIDVRAAHFIAVRSEDEMREALRSGVSPVLVIGGGSNILFTGDVAGLVVKNDISFINIAKSFKNRVWIDVGAGVQWHALVIWAVENNLGGLENLSLIPGTVGAAPVQNIGAYGVELRDVFVSLRAMETATGRVRSFRLKDCAFGYRDSVFKREFKGKYIILSIRISLSRHKHKLNLSYGDIGKTLAAMGIGHPGIADVSNAVCQIRRSKLPDPAEIGNCGSFFKNPETDITVLTDIRKTHPDVPSYPVAEGRVKVPAGWLIEQCGWKGKKVGNTGSYAKQALVLVNYGGATGQEVRNLSDQIILSVQQKFGITLEREVNIV
jgi:UDP-N-acetylmuramate dehydrogenase